MQEVSLIGGRGMWDELHYHFQIIQEKGLFMIPWILIPIECRIWSSISERVHNKCMAKEQ